MENKEKPRVIICMPVTDAGAIKARTANAIGCMIIKSDGLVTDFVMRMSADIASSRTYLVKEAMNRGGTHILFVDYDMFFPADTLIKLLAHEKEIVGIEYNKREFPVKGVFTPLEERSETDLYKARIAGTGLLLIDLSIFVDLGDPTPEHPNGNAWFAFGRDKEGSLVIGEDAWFCNVARDSGYDVWIDPTIKVGHLGEYMY